MIGGGVNCVNNVVLFFVIQFGDLCIHDITLILLINSMY